MHLLGVKHELHVRDAFEQDAHVLRRGDAAPADALPLGTQFEPQLFGRAARQSDDAFAMFANVCRAAESLGAAYYIFHGPVRPGCV